jgi:hypothetical protein
MSEVDGIELRLYSRGASAPYPDRFSYVTLPGIVIPLRITNCIVICMFHFGDMHTGFCEDPTSSLTSRFVETPFNLLHDGELHFFDRQRKCNQKKAHPTSSPFGNLGLI